ncbi:hypothetical protein EIP91_006231 [Steccherinum ochraceum]|uniref:DUF7918 domain-containing protein n=1 Tax=Steccherinum ochraceum TaxID=92696 RepID=A0A4R0RKQ7_9APHY|nr:hypothetical protein EIP91_006231 [Steccherinum ochraceum]
MVHIEGAEVQMVDEEKRPFREYESALSGNTTTCYVVSEPGKAFSIQVSNTRNDGVKLDFCVVVDGSSVAGVCCRPGKTSELKGIRVSPTSLRRLCFANVALTDDDAARETSRNLEQLGSVEVRVRRYTSQVVKAATKERENQKAPVAKKYNDIPQHLMQSTPIHEKSKKAGMHHISLGEELSVKAKSAKQSTSKTLWIDKKDCPFAIIKFIYRSEAVLRAMDIIPSPPVSSKAAAASKSREATDSESGTRKRTAVEDRKVPDSKRRRSSPVRTTSEAKRASSSNMGRQVKVEQLADSSADFGDVSLDAAKERLEEEQTKLIAQQEALVALQQAQVTMMRERVQRLERAHVGPSATASSSKVKIEDQLDGGRSFSRQDDVIDLTSD